ncbi:MAG: HPr family phosphocarrier protein [Gemmatimonadota bacterium]|nr:HPr family phosphocarrier protein [Gemmatimonadota bacterium]
MNIEPSERRESRNVRIPNLLGLHARPAADIVKLTSRYASDIFLAKGDLEVNGKSIMGVMMLAAECGVVLRVSASGPDSVEAVEALVALVKTGFGEELAEPSMWEDDDS